MAASGGVGLVTEPPTPPTSSTQEVFQWLKNLPLAPEYHPTLAEFQDPIAYIFKIEKEASKYGICKIVPPVLPPPKKTTISNLNRSLAARSATKSSPTFTTRQQQIGFCPRKPRPVQKPVWQSGEYYTFQEFEAKAKAFEKNYLKKCSKKGQGGLSPLEIETLYWKATVDKPFSVEYANDMPGSAFSAKKSGGGGGEGVTVGETEWNMRGVSRAKGSLLRFMKEEIPGVTSPMVYIAMLFSWFAWHVEDHDLHSLNYLHMGAGKTWYGVPREAAVAFEEVVRVHGYGGEINPLVTFAVLGEKTTVISPEVFISAGVPCCRLVQNAGEFVVTFPRAYHSGFSHGFNFGEAANIATPEWLRVAKDAAIRRASINYPPMVSHFQLLYDLALELCTRIPMSISSKPRSSRLKDKQKGEGETLVKDLFVKNIAHNNGLLHCLGNGSSVVILPHSSSEISLSSNLRIGSQLNLNSSLGLSNHKGFMKSLKSPVPHNIMSDSNSEVNQMKGFFSVKGKFDFVYERDRQAENLGSDSGSDVYGDKLSDQRLLSCVTCGVLSFDCVAIIQPSEGAARYLMSADCSFFNDWIVGSGVTSDKTLLRSRDSCAFERTSSTRLVGTNSIDGLYDASIQSSDHHTRTVDQNIEAASNNKPQREGSALGLLAITYGDSSDSEEDQCDPDISHDIDEINMRNTLESRHHPESSSLPSFKQEFHDVVNSSSAPSVSMVGCKDEVSPQTIDFHANDGRRVANIKDRNSQSPHRPVEFETDLVASNEVEGTFRGPMSSLHLPLAASLAPRSDEDSCRVHVFCLEHAIEVEQQLRSIGGAQILLLCHPEYLRIEAEAKLLSEELGIDCVWNEIAYRDATKEDEERIKSALDSEEAIPGNGDWAVKLGINLFYSANLSQSSLYSKQMPYNSVIYNAFGRTSPGSSPTKFNVYTRRPARQRKVVAGRWCGKVWMSNQVHPLLAKQDLEDQEQERNYLDSATAGENLERRTQSVHNSRNTSATRKSVRKRKVVSQSASVKKVKCLETENGLSDHSAGYDFCKQPMKTYSRKKSKFIRSEVSYGSQDSSHQKHGRIRRSKQVKSVERDDAVSDDSLEENSNQPRRRTLSRKEAKSTERDNIVTYSLAKSSSHSQHRRILKSKQAKLVERECAASDDSLEDDVHGWQGRVPRIRQAKFIEREDALSDDSPEGISHWLHGRSKQAFYNEKEDSASGSDDLPDDSSLRQLSRVPRGNHLKFIEREDAVSDDSMEEDTYRQEERLRRSKLGKFIETKGAVSDDNSDLQQKILRSKNCKFVEWGDGLLEDDIHQSHRRIPGNETANFSEGEDAVSDDSLDDGTQKQYTRIPKGKRAKHTDSEDVASDDLGQINISRQSRKPPRGKQQAEYLEREESVSDDLLEENNQQQSRILRSRRKKPITLGLARRKTSQLVKQGTQRPIRKEPSRSIKLERQRKHETPQTRKNKREQSARDSDSHDEEEREGGPSTRLRKRPAKPSKELEIKPKEKQQSSRKKMKNVAGKPVSGRKNLKMKDEETEYQCDIEGCTMGFDSKHDLAVHKRNICPVKGCGKKFFSHKYLVQHRRVHLDDRPLKCPWKGCKMTFKWAWARTEHIRVHTGARPYICSEEGCGQTFRFVSDFSRHKRKTGHSAKKTRG